MASSSHTRSRGTTLTGLAASAGIGVGRALRLDERGRQQFYFIGIPVPQVRREIKRLHKALAQARTQLQETKVRVALEFDGGIELRGAPHQPRSRPRVKAKPV